MPQTPDWAKYLNAGVEFVAVTRTQARGRAKELVAQGQLAQNQVQEFVDDLVDESRRRTDSMMELVRQEIGRQVKTLGIATKDDLARLEAKLVSQASRASKPPGAKKTAAKKSASKKAAGKKTASRKTAAKKTARKKTTAKKAS
jgi:polyhydroxyalkanoate synthesis regulator phasin